MWNGLVILEAAAISSVPRPSSFVSPLSPANTLFHLWRGFKVKPTERNVTINKREWGLTPEVYRERERERVRKHRHI